MTTELDDSETRRLVGLAAGGDQRAWSTLHDKHCGRLRNMVAFRMDRRLRGRISPSDVIQEACIVASRQLSDYAANPRMPFYLWLRWITGQRLMDQHRRHLGTQARGVARELSLYHGAFPETTTADLAAHLLGRWSSPSSAAMRIERKIRLQEALNQLEPIDREIVALRHFEELTNREAARVLNLETSAASKRYVRALQRLREVLLSMPGDEEWLQIPNS